jgi:hypothetical protein
MRHLLLIVVAGCVLLLMGATSTQIDLTSEVKNALPLANGGTAGITAAAALSNLLGNPSSGTYSINCSSGSSCTYTSAAGGGNVSTSSNMTSGAIPVATGTTTIANSLATDNGATLSYSGSGGIAATAAGANVIIGTAEASPAAAGGTSYNLYVNSTSKMLQCDYGATPTACVPTYTSGSSSSFNSNANYTMSSTSTFYDGPTTGSLPAGTYFVTETLTLGKASATAPAYAVCKLWDGTNVFAAAYPGMPYVTSATITYTTVTLSAVITESGTATIKTSCEPQTASEIMYYTTPAGSLNYATTISWVRLQ